MKTRVHTLVRFSLMFALLLALGVFVCAQSPSVSDIAESAAPSVVLIVVFDITGAPLGQGTGFFISPGKLLTNAHVVEGAYSAEIFSDTEYYDQVTVLKSSEHVDLALLSVDDRAETTLRLEKGREMRPGERIIAIGNPMGLEKTVSDGLISAVRGIPGEIQVIQISAPISPGSSGGPLLDEQGGVVGVTSAILSEGQNLNFAIGLETITDFLEKADDPRQLRRARTRVIWRLILRWIANLFFALVALVFGGGWWIIMTVLMICAFFVWLFMGLCSLVMKPFRKRRTDTTGNYSFDTLSRSHEEPIHDSERELSSLLPDIENDDQIDGELFRFHCWKCGAEVFVDFVDKPDSIECDKCGTKLTVPKEQKTGDSA